MAANNVTRTSIATRLPLAKRFLATSPIALRISLSSMGRSDESGVVLWDFDGTLAWREGLWRSALVSALDEVSPGHGITGDMLRPGLEDGFPWHRPDIAHPHLATSGLWWAHLVPVFESAYRRVGVDEEIASIAARLVSRIYSDPLHWSVYSDTLPALRRVRAAGWRNVILSNHVPELPRLIEDVKLHILVDDVITSAASGFEKPNREVFRTALDRLGRPRNVWMVGDNPIADITGAKAIGIRSLLVRTPDRDGTSRTLMHAIDIILHASPQDEP